MLIPGGILLPSYTKPALTYEQQLDDKLIPRGLIIEDRESALRWLKRIGYYRLSGYLYPFRVSPVDDNFRPGSSFDKAIKIYKFDCHLRLLLLQAIDRIEIAIRASVTYNLGHNLGPFGHMDARNFKPYVPGTATAPADGMDFPQFTRRISDDEKNSSEVFIDHYRSNYSDPHLPIWMLTEIVSFGTLSRITENLADKDLKRMVARDFALSQTQLISWIKCLHYIRNVCAHHGRLWNRTLSVKPELLPRWKVAGVTRDRIYVVLLVVVWMMQQVAPKSRWRDRLMFHVLDNPDMDRAAMHFPHAWEEMSPWSDASLLS